MMVQSHRMIGGPHRRRTGAIEQVVECLVLVAVRQACTALGGGPTASDPMCEVLGYRLPPTHE